MRIPTERDIPHVFSATRFAGFNDGMPWDAPVSEDELRGPLQRSLEAWKEGRGYSFAIEAGGGPEFFGRISIRKTPQPGTWNIGFWLHPEQQGKGLMTEAARAVVSLGFGRLEAEAIEACHAVWNTKSRRVLERLEMTEVEYLPEGFKKRGEWVPEYRMRIERKAWKGPCDSPVPALASVKPPSGREPRDP